LEGIAFNLEVWQLQFEGITVPPEGAAFPSEGTAFPFAGPADIADD
jgi:hypothetical protein